MLISAPLIVEAVLHLHVDRPAQRIEPESGIVGHDGDRPDRGGRNQVPVDGVAERFVDARPVLVNRESLRRAGDRGCDKAAELYVGLEWISGRVADDNARHLLLQGVRDVQRAGALDLPRTKRVDARGHLVDVHSRARRRRRRGRVDKDPAHVSGGPGRISVAGRSGGSSRGNDLDGGQYLGVVGRGLGLSTTHFREQDISISWILSR